MYATGTERSERKMILNSNQGVTNIIESDVIHSDMAKVTDRIFNILKAHYGPYSKFAGVDPNQPLEDTIFTKDGANIIKSVEFASPLEDVVRKAVYYIGDNVEKSSGDGTTSSMMFMCAMLKHMNATIDQIRPISYKQLSNAFAEFISDVKGKMAEYTISAKNEDGTYSLEKVRQIVWTQTYTSSHGNYALADAVADMFAKTPPEMWPKMTFARRRYETDKEFEVKSTEGQYQLDNCSIQSKSCFNMDAGRYLEYKDCTLIVLNAKADVNNPHWISTVKPILDECDTDHPVVLLAHPGADNFSYGQLMEFISKKNEKTNKTRAFAAVWYEPTHNRLNDFVNIQVIAGNDPTKYADGEFSGIPCVIEHAYIKYEFDNLIIDNLYKDDRSHDVINERPGFSDPDTPYFRTWSDTIQKFISAYEAGDLVSLKQKRELNDFRNVYQRLRYDKQMFLLIGGKTFDNLQMYDVVEDVIKAAIHTLGTGAVVSNNKSLYRATNVIIWYLKSRAENLAEHGEELARDEKLQLWIARNVIASLNEFSDVVLDQLYPHGIETIKDHPRNSLWHKLAELFGRSSVDRQIDGVINNFGCDIPSYNYQPSTTFSQEEREGFRKWWFEHSVDLLAYDPARSWSEQLDHHVTVPMDRVTSRGACLTKDDRLIVQPANADIVMLERFAEIAIKFILTERFIVINGAYLNKEKKGKK